MKAVSKQEGRNWMALVFTLVLAITLIVIPVNAANCNTEQRAVDSEMGMSSESNMNMNMNMNVKENVWLAVGSTPALIEAGTPTRLAVVVLDDHGLLCEEFHARILDENGSVLTKLDVENGVGVIETEFPAGGRYAVELYAPTMMRMGSMRSTESMGSMETPKDEMGTSMNMNEETGSEEHERRDVDPRPLAVYYISVADTMM